MEISYIEVYCEKALDHTDVIGTRLWTRHCLDPYINCEFSCVYCDSGVKGKEHHDVSNVYVKLNVAATLERELQNLKRRGVVNLGAATDIYQPAEKKYHITRQILSVLEKHGCPFAFGTKSDLILRDLKIILNASKKSWCCISVSLTTLDRYLARLLEPYASSPERRLEVVKKLSEQGIVTGIWLTPIIPYITDNQENLSDVIAAAVESGATFVLGGALDMRNSLRFKSFLAENFPELIPKYRALYGPDHKIRYYPHEGYLYELYKRFIATCNRQNVKKYIPHFHRTKQALLFYIRNFARFKGSPLFELTQLFNYLSPSKEFLQNIRIRFYKSKTAEKLLESLNYFPH